MRANLEIGLVLAGLALANSAAAQFSFTTNMDNTVTITGYTGSGGDVTIPSVVNGLSVTTIGDFAFSGLTNVSSVTIPDSVVKINGAAFGGCALTSVTIGSGVTYIGNYAFCGCGLTSVLIPNGVTSIGAEAFSVCGSLTNVAVGSGVISIGNYAFNSCLDLAAVTIREGVTGIGDWAFGYCQSLTSLTIPNSVTSLGEGAFDSCANLTNVYFEGNAPTTGPGVFGFDPVIVNYLPGTLGWEGFSRDLYVRTAPWFLPRPLILNRGPGFGVRSNQFGFTISWATNVPVLVEAATNLSNPIWAPLSTNTLLGGSSHFSDAAWTNYPQRFYRLTVP
jgi:hypothetical protein